MVVDIRCQFYCKMGYVVEGVISDDQVQDNWLIRTKGRLVIDRVFQPKKGKRVRMSYRRGNKVAPFPRYMVVTSSTSDPYLGTTTLEIGDPLVLLEGRREKAVVEAETDPFEPELAPQPVMAQAVLAKCLERLGMTLDSSSVSLVNSYLWKDFDLTQGYVDAIQRLIESEGCYGYVTDTGGLRIRKLKLNEPEDGPLFTWQDLSLIQHIPGAPPPPDSVEVVHTGREAPSAAGGGGSAAGEDWYPSFDDGYGGFDDWRGSSGLDDYSPEDDGSEDSARNWEYSRTVGFPTRTVIQYGQDQEAEFQHTPIAYERVDYGGFGVYNPDTRKVETREYVTSRDAENTTCMAQANGSMVKWQLENFDGGSQGSAPVSSRSRSVYSYSITTDGPRYTKEDRYEYISGAQFAGSLNIENYADLAIPSDVLAHHTTTITDVNMSEDITRTKVIRRSAWGLTQEGQQIAANIIKKFDGNSAAINKLLVDMQAVVGDGVETRTSRGRGGGVQTRPSRQATLGDAIDPRGDTPKSIVQQIELAEDPQSAVETTERWQSPMDDSEDAVNEVLQMPLSPDDWYSGLEGGGVKLNRGGASNAVRRYGRAVMALRVGRAYGLTIEGDPWRLPTKPLKPIYITHAGQTNAFRLNGLTWAISGNGMAVGADTLLCGAVATEAP